MKTYLLIFVKNHKINQKTLEFLLNKINPVQYDLISVNPINSIQPRTESNKNLIADTSLLQEKYDAKSDDWFIFFDHRLDYPNSFENTFEKVQSFDCGIYVNPVHDTVKTIDTELNKVIETLDRSQLRIVSYPQFFNGDVWNGYWKNEMANFEPTHLLEYALQNKFSVTYFANG